MRVYCCRRMSLYWDLWDRVRACVREILRRRTSVELSYWSDGTSVPVRDIFLSLLMVVQHDTTEFRLFVCY